MKLSEIFTQLAYGELSQLALGKNSDGELSEANFPALVSHVNLGLTALYKRFTLKEGRLTLALQSGMMTYPLAPAYAVNAVGSTQPVRFIEDTVEAPFLGDIHKVERIYTEAGWEMGLNDVDDEYACTTPSMLVLRVPAAVVAQEAALPSELKTSKLDVVYRANHPAIELRGGYIDPTKAEIELPISHLEALLYFVASRVNNPIGMSNEFHAGNSWAAKYEMECAKLETFDLRIDQGSRNTRLERNGWV